MLAYSAWDGLQAIARQYDADLDIVSGSRIALAPRRTRTSASGPIRRLTERLRIGSPNARSTDAARRGNSQR